MSGDNYMDYEEHGGLQRRLPERSPPMAVNIEITGLRASGKTHLSRYFAEAVERFKSELPAMDIDLRIKERSSENSPWYVEPEFRQRNRTETDPAISQARIDYFFNPDGDGEP
jgi:hypothetical protein